MKSSLVLSLFSLGATALLVSCSDSGGGKSALKIPVSSKSVGTFTSEKSEEFDYSTQKYPTLKLAEEEARCVIEEGMIAKFDPRLRPGDKFVEVNSGKDRNSSSSSRATVVVKTVSPTRLEKDASITDIHATNFPTAVPSKVTQKVVCQTTQTSEGRHEECDTQWLDWQPPKESQSGEICNGKRLDKSDRKGTVSIGQYKLANGNVVTAKREEESETVEVVCRKDGKETNLGKGTEVNVYVSSFGTVQTNAFKCPTSDILFQYTLLTLEDGTVIESYARETLEAPAR